ncbi:sulfurtransferase complex subunit TusC [Otariodibacter oris]|uniref:tRNA 2-thiouridine synthesizing protein C n=1 Tax=Otariodibacter oris TaxID=1032623 RepID=A0A420XFZ4_9PAST|nr:sulfurtransferase complex subunit TusC [Otariodibacter oris]QGM79922.1 tRNA 2-thiouridine(34) synthase TusC [Otariodibacter oris]RKR71281.1 tRNA 2-thiouridine synthesizing protein C [Otariodibacter oris]
MKDHYKIAVLFTQPPFGSAVSREGLDAILAASAYCEEDEIAICFLQDGIFNLIANQDPKAILQKDHISTFKLLELYDLNECFICESDIEKRGLVEAEWILSNLNFVTKSTIFEILKKSDKILTF